MTLNDCLASQAAAAAHYPLSSKNACTRAKRITACLRQLATEKFLRHVGLRTYCCVVENVKSLLIRENS